jgi:Tfp pilus assembly protein PilO
LNLKKSQNGIAMVSEIDGAGAVALIVLSVLFYFAAMKPLLDRAHAEEAQRQELELRRAKAEQSALALQATTERLSELRSAIANNPQKLEPVRALNDRLGKIAALATARGLDIGDIRPGAVSVGERYSTVPISLVGTGKFQNCVRYMHDVQQKFGDTTVTAVKLTGTPDESSGTAAFQFELRWYAAPDAGVVAPRGR